jgi:hypothetical protein
VILEGRRIFLNQSGKLKLLNTAYLSVFSRDGNTSLTQGVTINLNSKSHEQAQAYLLKEHLKAKVQQG